MEQTKILIVDDEPNIVLSLDYLVRKKGFVPFIARNGAEALSIAEKECPNLIVLDIMMPDMDGYTLTAEVKADPKLRGLHVILHTSLSGVFNQQMVQKVGAEDFIAKFNPDELAQSVQKWLHAD